MRIKIEKLKEGDNTVIFDVSETEAVLNSDFDIKESSILSLNIQKSGNYLHVRGTVSVSYDSVCDRCAENFSSVAIVNIDYFFHIGEIEGSSANDVEIIFPERTDGYLIFEDYFRESFILALPPRSLCKNNCKGLCDKCGANLNLKKCGCSGNDKTDPRWETLTQLLKKNK